MIKEGIDSRKDGLIWIVKALWLLNQDVEVSDMPSFLDSELIKFLLEYGKMDIKRGELHLMLKEFKFKSRKDRISKVFMDKAKNQVENGLFSDKNLNKNDNL